MLARWSYRSDGHAGRHHQPNSYRRRRGWWPPIQKPQSVRRRTRQDSKSSYYLNGAHQLTRWSHRLAVVYEDVILQICIEVDEVAGKRFKATKRPSATAQERKICHTLSAGGVTLTRWSTVCGHTQRCHPSIGIAGDELLASELKATKRPSRTGHINRVATIY